MIWWASKKRRNKQRTPFNNKPRILNREKVCFIKLRRCGVSLNQIAEAFGRSVSAVWRTIKNAESFRVIRKIDNRKLPPTIRRRSASLRWQTLMKLISKWESWILGEGLRPP